MLFYYNANKFNYINRLNKYIFIYNNLNYSNNI